MREISIYILVINLVFTNIVFFTSSNLTNLQIIGYLTCVAASAFLIFLILNPKKWKD